MKTTCLESLPCREVFKCGLVLLLISQVIVPVAMMPQDLQRRNVQFPTANKKSIFPSAQSQNGVIPILGVNNTNLNGGSSGGGGPVQSQSPSISTEFEMGTTGIPCDQPGTFVTAPDGCNRCFCAQNRQLSSACSRVFCPPGFPSSSPGQYKR